MWEPAKYAEFADFRNRPFFDLTSRIAAASPRKVVDLGCGPGNLTATLARRWPQAQVLGVDSSAEMIAAAAPLAERVDAGTFVGQEAHPAQGLAFMQGEIGLWQPESDTDVIVSNAALQWVPEHRSLMSRWLAALRPGSWLAVQVPGNFTAPSHTLMRELAESRRWRKQLGGVLRHDDVVGEPGEYHELFLKAGARADVWESSYHQLLSGPDPVLEWVRGTALRPVLSVLNAADGAEFERVYAEQLAVAYPPGEFGTTFPFRRIFMVGEKQ